MSKELTEESQDNVKKSHNMTENEQKLEKNTQYEQKNCLSLTEQWRNGTLPNGAYYILVDKYEQNEPEIDVGVCYNSNFEWWIVKEVLAKVPSYKEYQALLSDSLAKNEGEEIIAELESKLSAISEQLKEANEVIRFYSTEKPPLNCPVVGKRNTYYPYKYNYVMAIDYLKKYGVEK